MGSTYIYNNPHFIANFQTKFNIKLFLGILYEKILPTL